MKKIISVAVIASTLLLAPAVFADAAPKEAMKMPAPKADIYIIPEAKSIPLTLTYPATVTAYNNVEVVARALGILKTKYFTEGQKVNKGDLLYQIEDDVYLAKVEAAQASLNMAEALRDNATRNWERVKKLFNQKAISQEDRDNALSSYEQSLAAVSLAKAELKQSSINLEYTKVKAPLSGITGLKKVDIGDLVSSNPPTPLVEITQNDKVYIDFSAPMSDYKKIKNKIWSIQGDKVEISLEVDGKILDKKGVVDFIDVNTNNQTAIVKMRAVVDNSDNYLMPGQFVRVITKNIVQSNVITIPQKALLQNPLGTIVFIEEKGHVAIRPVLIGNESGSNYIVAGGPLKSGDKVIVNNFFRLKPGGEVSVDKTINEQDK